MKRTFCLLMLLALSGVGCEKQLTTETSKNTPFTPTPNTLIMARGFSQDENGRVADINALISFDKDGRMIPLGTAIQTEAGFNGTAKQAAVGFTNGAGGMISLGALLRPGNFTGGGSPTINTTATSNSILNGGGTP